ncbi:MAG: hypothetical protein U0521_08505 [Anaerolineae bacterium]
MNDSKASRARDLILLDGQYDAARKLFMTIPDHPEAKYWLPRLDKMLNPTEVTQPANPIQPPLIKETLPSHQAQPRKEDSEQSQERHRYLGTFNFLGGFVGFLLFLGGIDRMGVAGGNGGTLVVLGIFLIGMYVAVLRVSHNFHEWNALPWTEKLFAWLTTLWIGCILGIIILPAIAVGTALGIGDL